MGATNELAAYRHAQCARSRLLLHSAPAVRQKKKKTRFGAEGMLTRKRFLASRVGRQSARRGDEEQMKRTDQLHSTRAPQAKQKKQKKNR